MSDDSSTPPPKPVEPVQKPFTPTWKLPDGIEDTLTMGIIHTTVGVTIGGLVGLALFKAGKGNRAMSMATGLGVALGSTYERAVETATTQE